MNHVGSAGTLILMTDVQPVPEGLAEQAATLGDAASILDAKQVAHHIRTALAAYDLDGKRVTLVVPDATRSAPMPMVLAPIRDALAGRATSVNVVVALGTHAAMDEDALGAYLGYEPGRSEETYPGWRIVNHEWWLPETFADLGTISADEVTAYSGGLLHDVPMRVLVNRLVVDTDISLVVGPVLPHEVVGFSGGNKYFFPGLSGHDVIDLSHWVGALITSAQIIGTLGITPVRAMINAAADRVPSQKLCVAFVTVSGTDQLHAVCVGTTEAAWAAAAPIAAESHIEYLAEPVSRVLSIIDERYEDIWTAAKGFYKLEPVVADGGEVILYAPHITEVSRMHPGLLEIGYHTRDYFVAQWDEFRDHSWGELAHSTHLRGAGTYDAATGVETPRVTVTLATQIPCDVVESVGLRWMDPADVDIAAMSADPNTLVVPDAGEVLYRLRGNA